MAYNLNIEELKDTIEKKRQELNKLLSEENIDRKRVLELSEQLDELIYKYYCSSEEQID